jgi:CheY-like chemotaxis protein
LSIANVLNGTEDSNDYFNNLKSNDRIRFTISNARLLVVDDIATNLKVAVGLLAPYCAAVDTCLSGAEAIDFVKQQNYDLIFMDHMMPEMDGIEATAAIRAWETEQNIDNPAVIVALTANAVSGMKEMFIEKGFNDFLAKPIDISRLDEILSVWIPKTKRNEQIADCNEQSKPANNGKSSLFTANSSLNSIPGVDVKYGIAMTGGAVKLYSQVLSVFCKDAEARLPLFSALPDADRLTAFVTQVHALKSASATIGARDVSGLASELEHAGNAGDMECIKKQLPVFVKQLAGLIGGIRAALEPAEKHSDPSPSAPRSHFL